MIMAGLEKNCFPTGSGKTHPPPSHYHSMIELIEKEVSRT